MTLMRVGTIAGALILCLAGLAAGAELKKETVTAFDSYIRKTESRIAEQVSGERSFLWVDESPQRREMVRQGEVVAQPWNARGDVEVPSGLIHDWIGAVFIPGTTLEKTLALIRNYDIHSTIYQPEVIGSKVLEHDKDHYRVYLRLLKKKVITVVLNTEHDVQYYRLDDLRWYSRSYSTRVTQVDNPGERDEREMPLGRDRGLLWKLDSYWRFEERDGGVYVECQAVSLTRDIPKGLGWLIEPIIRDLPKESLVRTLDATRRALRHE
jgi:hypothetical protein